MEEREAEVSRQRLRNQAKKEKKRQERLAKEAAGILAPVTNHPVQKTGGKKNRTPEEIAARKARKESGKAQGPVHNHPTKTPEVMTKNAKKMQKANELKRRRDALAAERKEKQKAEARARTEEKERREKEEKEEKERAEKKKEQKDKDEKEARAAAQQKEAAVAKELADAKVAEDARKKKAQQGQAAKLKRKMRREAAAAGITIATDDVATATATTSEPPKSETVTNNSSKATNTSNDSNTADERHEAPAKKSDVKKVEKKTDSKIEKNLEKEKTDVKIKTKTSGAVPVFLFVDGNINECIKNGLRDSANKPSETSVNNVTNKWVAAWVSWGNSSSSGRNNEKVLSNAATTFSISKRSLLDVGSSGIGLGGKSCDSEISQKEDTDFVQNWRNGNTFNKHPNPTHVSFSVTEEQLATVFYVVDPSRMESAIVLDSTGSVISSSSSVAGSAKSSEPTAGVDGIEGASENQIMTISDSESKAVVAMRKAPRELRRFFRGEEELLFLGAPKDVKSESSKENRVKKSTRIRHREKELTELLGVSSLVSRGDNRYRMRQRDYMWVISKCDPAKMIGISTVKGSGKGLSSYTGRK
jgi:hypothetical protein